MCYNFRATLLTQKNAQYHMSSINLPLKFILSNRSDHDFHVNIYIYNILPLHDFKINLPISLYYLTFLCLSYKLQKSMIFKNKTTAYSISNKLEGTAIRRYTSSKMLVTRNTKVCLFDYCLTAHQRHILSH